ncbi:hypothetical protein ACQUY5_16740 [Bacillus cereus]|uniref:hypothetical protein n=1 Tax=Bacillus cereus TaxID=1396 RepID=UPI003D169A77
MITDKLEITEDVVSLAITNGIKSCVVYTEDTTNRIFDNPYMIMTEDNYRVARYHSKEQLDRLLKLTDIELTPFVTKQTEENGEVIVYKPSKEIVRVGVFNTNHIPNTDTTRVVRGVVKGFIVDITLDIKETEVDIYVPSTDCNVNGLNVITDPVQVIDFYNLNGSINEEA